MSTRSSRDTILMLTVHWVYIKLNFSKLKTFKQYGGVENGIVALEG